MAGAATEQAIRVLLVDDDPYVRKAVAAVVSGEPDLELVGEADDGVRALQLVDELDPDVLLLDLEMPTMGGLQVVQRLQRRPGAPRVLVLTNHMADRYIAETLRGGAAGFLVKNTGPDDLVSAVRAAHCGEAVLSADVTRRMIDSFVSQGATESGTDRLAGLTEREREVALAVAAGQSNQEISDQLFMSLSTVKTNVSRILAKLGLSNRVQVALLVHGVHLDAGPED